MSFMWRRTNIVLRKEYCFYLSRFKTNTTHNDLSEKQKALLSKGLPKKRKIPAVENVVLVASGKGGVGKSTTAVNIAVALKHLVKGKGIGLLDMDVFGPSLPIMMNLGKHKPDVDINDKMIPLMNYGIHCMSIGFLVPEDAAVVWRGPMVMSAIQRLLLNTAWPPLDTLVLDLPPGTGDVPLSISQLVNVKGAVLVTTPQDVALADVTRGAQMFQKMNVPVLGVVQNMSVYQCPKCGNTEHIFGSNGANRIAQQLDVPVLGDIPISLGIREGGDSGAPVTVTQPDSYLAKCYSSIAERLLNRMEETR